MFFALRCYLKYYWYRFRFPGWADYLDKGIGIEARYCACSAAWEPHLTACREFLCSALQGGRGRLLLAGSGRLLDVDPVFLLEHFERIELLDADPSARGSARRLARAARPGQVCFSLGDVTGCITDWTMAAKQFWQCGQGSEQQAMASFLKGLECGAASTIGSGRYDVIISLNLLSQIPLFWHDRWQRLAGRRCDQGPEVKKALAASMLRLQQKHLGDLNASTARTIVVISDKRWRSEESAWVSLAPDIALPEYECFMEQSWEWRVVPGEGIIHAVQAYAFRRRESR